MSGTFSHCLEELEVNGEKHSFYSLPKLKDDRIGRLPYSIRILLESAIRNCDEFQVHSADVEKILDWNKTQTQSVEVPFKPARVILQDFTGVPAVVDFAAMRDAMKSLGGEPSRINPICPVDLVIDHSVQVDAARSLRSAARGHACLSHGRRQPTRARLLANQRSATANTTNQRSATTNITNESSASSPSTNSCTDKSSVHCDINPAMRDTPVDSHRTNHVTEHKVSTSDNVASVNKTESDLKQSNDLSSKEQTENKRATFRLAPHRTSFNLSPHGASLSPLGASPRRTDESRVSLRPEKPSAVCDTCRLEARAMPVTYSRCPFHLLRSLGADALEKNQQLEFERNKERFQFLKWGARAFRNMQIIPPGSGIVHQVNLEYLARLVFNSENTLYPDSLVGTDSHTTMINGLGVLGWGVGGIEAEAVMLGQAISMLLPPVVGYKITGDLSPMVTSTDLVLTITKHLRSIGVVGKFVEFYGPGVSQLSVADRATIANMCPEYGATVGFFAVDQHSINYLRQTGRDEKKVSVMEQYLRKNGLLRDFSDQAQDPEYSQVVELDLGSVVACCSGPKRPHDRVSVAEMKQDFNQCLSNKPGFKGFGVPSDRLGVTVPFVYDGQEYLLRHGSVVIAAITSCTNTSNPSVMLGAGLLAKRAVEKGLSVSPFIKTSLSPGSGVVTHYLRESGVMPYLQKLGFDVVGYGCMTCIGNSGPLPTEVADAIEKGELVASGVLSGNRNFEGRIHPLTQANYLASPMLVVAYAIAGSVDIDFETQPLGSDEAGNAVYLRDIWPSRKDIQAVEGEVVVPAMFRTVYDAVQTGNTSWNELEAPTGDLYPWSDVSTYIRRPPFFDDVTHEVPELRPIESASVLLFLGDSVTTDHISPAGSIARNSPAARHLASHGLTPREFNSYGSRRGNHDIMARGTFANIRLVNKFMSSPGPKTLHLPSGETMDVFDAAMRYKDTQTPVIIVAGKDYGSGSSRDWAAKGPWMLGVRAVIAESFERIHRTNLVGMGILPLQFVAGQSASTLGLTAREQYTIGIPEKPRQQVSVKAGDVTFEAVARLDTELEMTYFRHRAILNYTLHVLCKQ